MSEGCPGTDELFRSEVWLLQQFFMAQIINTSSYSITHEEDFVYEGKIIPMCEKF